MDSDGSREFFSRPDEPGTVPKGIGPYGIVSLLARGGQALVYLAQHPHLPKKVVLKVLRGDLLEPGSAAIERLRREAEMLSRIDHDGICSVVDVVHHDDALVVVLPYIEGESLAARIDRAAAAVAAGATAHRAWAEITARPPDSEVNSVAGPASPPTSPLAGTEEEPRSDLRSILRLVEDVALAVHAAHERGVVHRDLKPGNIMLRPDGRPVVLDFGLALDVSAQGLPRLSQEGQRVGTPQYMAPEQIRGQCAAIGVRTDVYALGLILYELLAFRRPFAGSQVDAIYRNVLEGRFERLRRVNPLVPLDLEAVCTKAMEADPRPRYASALEFAQDLRRVRLLEPTVARPVSGARRLVRRLRRHALMSSLALATALLLGLWGWEQVQDRSAQLQFHVLQRLYEVWIKTGRPDPRDVQQVRELYPAATADLLLDLPRTQEDWLSRFSVMSEALMRAPVTGLELLGPRGAITDPQPRFRFRTTSGDPGRVDASAFGLRVMSVAGQWLAGGAKREGDELVLTLPPGTILAPGDYRWGVGYSLVPDPPAGAWAGFRVIDPEAWRSTEARLEPTGEPTLDALLRVAAALTLELAEEALRRLDALPPSVPEWAEAPKLLFRARAHAILGDGPAVARCEEDYWRRVGPR